MAELALDDVQRDALPSEFKGVGVAQLVWREPASYPCLTGEPTKLDAYSGTRPGASAGRTVDDAEQWSDRQIATRGEPGE